MRPVVTSPAQDVPYWRKVLGIAVTIGINAFFVEPAIQHVGGQDGFVLRLMLRVVLFVLVAGIVFALVYRNWGRPSS